MLVNILIAAVFAASSPVNNVVVMKVYDNQEECFKDVISFEKHFQEEGATLVADCITLPIENLPPFLTQPIKL